MRICGIVVTYFPNIQESERNIRQYIDAIDHLIIWENTPLEESPTYKLLLPDKDDKITYMGTGENMGISYALNQALDYASNNGFTHLLTMDQDSFWVDFELFKMFVSLNNPADTIFGPLINNENPTIVNKKLDFMITSGMLLPIAVLQKLGGYWEKLKIDGIDTELFYRAKQVGVKIRKSPVGHLFQQFGTFSSFQILGCRISYSEYSSFRLYGILYNRMIIMRMYKTSLKYIISTIKTPFSFSLKILLSDESNKFRKICAIWRGCWMGLTCNINKLCPIRPQEINFNK